MGRKHPKRKAGRTTTSASKAKRRRKSSTKSSKSGLKREVANRKNLRRRTSAKSDPGQGEITDSPVSITDTPTEFAFPDESWEFLEALEQMLDDAEIDHYWEGERLFVPAEDSEEADAIISMAYHPDSFDSFWDQLEDKYYEDVQRGLDERLERLYGKSEDDILELPPEFEINGYRFGGLGHSNPDAQLDGVDLSGKEMMVSNLERANLRGAKLDSSGLSGANLIDADLTGASLIGANLCNAELAGTNFCRAILIQADLSGADLARVSRWDEDGNEYLERHKSSASFQNADLSAATLRAVRGHEARFDSANLSKADLSSKTFLFDFTIDQFGELTYLDRAVFDDATMIGANLSCANLHSASFQGADLRGADLSGADLRNANLTGANLTGARLIGGRIKWSGSGTQHDRMVSGAMLAGARLSRAILIGVNFEGVDLTDTDLSEAILTEDSA